MRRRLFSLAGVAALLFVTAGLAFAQDSQGAADEWTVVEYPEGREVVVELRLTALNPNAKGAARVTRGADSGDPCVGDTVARRSKGESGETMSG